VKYCYSRLIISVQIVCTCEGLNPLMYLSSACATEMSGLNHYPVQPWLSSVGHGYLMAPLPARVQHRALSANLGHTYIQTCLTYNCNFWNKKKNNCFISGLTGQKAKKNRWVGHTVGGEWTNSRLRLRLPL